ncbi:hypothetical protein [Sporosarcina limicola]|uniref:Uncharacterized protein n=1 Tax=Sporosarcina limicola TaxID=34101 RepID=A0A927MI04_9BACL|nr:hypothetical protein [Sporosarcina limicola]MBE1554770.1 hypothetical protein [Sporosarcina limicola]
MYSIQQLQAADYLVKKITNLPISQFVNKDLKFVIEFNGILWYGDFLHYSERAVKHFYIDKNGAIEYRFLYTEGNDATPLLVKANSAFYESIPKGDWATNPYQYIDTLDLLFNSLLKIIDNIDIQVDDSPIYPYLLNARSLDGKLELPFINIGNEKVKIVSLIESER